MKRWLPHPMQSLALLAFWLLLNTPASLGNWLLGLLLAWLAPWLAQTLIPAGQVPRAPLVAAGLFLRVCADSIRSAFVVALLIGGVIAAPIAAWLVRLLAPRILAVGAGGLIIVTNSRTLLSTDAARSALPAGASTIVLIVLAAAWIATLGWVIRQQVATSAADAAREPEKVPSET